MAVFEPFVATGWGQVPAATRTDLGANVPLEGIFLSEWAQAGPELATKQCHAILLKSKSSC